MYPAMRLNPYYPDWYLWYLGEAYCPVGDYGATIETLKKMRDQSEGHRLLAASYAHLEQRAKRVTTRQQVLRLTPTFRSPSWRTVPPYKDPANSSGSWTGLRRAGLK